MTVFLLIVFILLVLGAVKGVSQALGLLSLGKGAQAGISFIWGVLMAILAVVLWVVSLGERLND